VSGRTDSSVLGEGIEAFVWMAAQASSVDEFTKRIENTLYELQLDLIALEEIRTAEEADKTDLRSEELSELIARVRADEHRVAYGKFYRSIHHT
jgi:hypothetical protein